MNPIDTPVIVPATPTGRVFSGVQPSGKLHLGNYFGAIRQHIALQDAGTCFFFIADFHALTTVRDPAELQANVRDAAVTYLALGLAPDRTVFFRQSDVPEVTELAWYLSAVTNLGLLERAVSYKDKQAHGIEASVGLFTYPVLMAADILAFRGEVIPVGKDQVQHIEMTREMAGRFNRRYGETFPYPTAVLAPESWVPGLDGRKMSKSYGNTIDIFAEGKELEKAVARVVTDSAGVADPKNPDTCSLFAMYQLFATPAEADDLAARYRHGGVGYGEVKRAVVRRIEERFAAARDRRQQLLAGGEWSEVLRAGAARARAEAARTLDTVRAAVGIAPPRAGLEPLLRSDGW